MRKSHYPFYIAHKKYVLNKFKIRPCSKGEFLCLCYLEQKIGYFSRITDIVTTNCNGKNKYFFIKHEDGVIGTISFEFNDKNKRWKIGYVKLTAMPEQFIFIRKVLFEKSNIFIIQNILKNNSF